MWLHLVVLVVALAGLVKSADYLVEYAARLARRFQVSELVVGLVITSVGTSLPELASSISAALAGSPGLVIGNVVGSNIANIGLVLGAAAIIRPLVTEPRMHDRDGIILLAGTLLFFALALNNRVERLDAALFLIVYLAYVVFAARTDREGIAHQFQDFLKFVFDFEYAAPLKRRLMMRGPAAAAAPHSQRPAVTGEMLRELVIIMGALVGLIISARFVVAEAIWLARLVQLPENLIGLSLVAVGTSLPELLVAIAGARKGKAEMVVGNVIGSNIANTLLIIGVAAMISPLEVSELSVVYTIPIMLFASLALLYFVRTDWRIGRAQGLAAVVGYAVFLGLAFLQGWG
jgi:cation:H+ antiporter